MKMIGAQVDEDTIFRSWAGDMHRPEVVIWSGRRQVPTVLRDRRADGTVVLGAVDAARLDAISDGGRLAVIFRPDLARLKKGVVVPLFTTDYVVDRHRGMVEARFTAGTATRRYLLPVAITAGLECAVLFRRRRVVTVVRLSPYDGQFLIEDPGRCLSPGMTVWIDAWLPWLGQVRLHAQLTACRDEVGVSQFSFRLVDRKSVAACAVILAGTVDEFDFGVLRATGVRPSRLSRLLTVQIVADRSAFRDVLELRLASNRKFGRLAGVRDAAAVADHLDRHSVNFVCLLGDKALGTGRVVVNSGNRELSEIEAETGGLPGWIWSGGFIEISRLAIHPDYGGGGVNVILFREIARLAFNLGCRYLVLDAIEKLVPLYEKIGAERLPLTKTHPYSDETVYIMVIDIGEQLGRLDRRLPYWQYVFGPVLKHHLGTSSPDALTARVGGRRKGPFWIKRMLSHVG